MNKYYHSVSKKGREKTGGIGPTCQSGGRTGGSKRSEKTVFNVETRKHNCVANDFVRGRSYRMDAQSQLFLNILKVFVKSHDRAVVVFRDYRDIAVGKVNGLSFFL